MNWKACREETTSSSESSPVPAVVLGSPVNGVWSCSYSEGFHFQGSERENVSFRCEVISSYLSPPLSTVQKYPGPTGDFRGRKGSGDEALIIVCLSLLSHQGRTQRATVGSLDSWKVLPIKHLTKPHLLRCVQC